MKWHEFIIVFPDNLSLTNSDFMRSVLFLFAMLFVIGWIVGYYLYGFPGFIHMLLVLISLVLGFMRRA